METKKCTKNNRTGPHKTKSLVPCRGRY